MKYSVYILILIIICSGLFSTIAFEPLLTVSAAQSSGYNYYIFTNSTSTYVKNVATGAIISQNHNATLLFASIPQGTSWYIEAGTYVGVISINKSQTSVMGSGIDSTIVKTPASVQRNCIEAIGSVNGRLNNIYIGSLTVNGQWDLNATNPPKVPPAEPNELQQNGVSLQYIDNATVENVKAYNTPWNGIQAYQSRFIKLKNDFVSQIFWNGLQFWGSTSYSSIDNCSTNMTATGVADEYGSNFNSITNTQVNNSGYWGGATWGGSSGIALSYGVNNIQVFDVQVYNAPWGISSFNSGSQISYNITISRAQINNTLDGIVLSNVNNLTLTTSSITNSTWGNAIYSTYSSNVMIANNTFNSPGIYLASSSNNWYIAYNTFKQMKFKAIVINDSSCIGNTILGNNFIDQVNPISDSGTGTKIIKYSVLGNTFGQTSVGGNVIGTGTGAAKTAGRFSLVNSGTVTKLTAYIRGTGFAKAAIYSDLNGQPNLPIGGATAQVPVPSNGGWVDFAYVTPVHLTAGYYWLTLIDNSGCSWYYDLGGVSAWNWVSYSNEPISPFGSHTDRTDLISIYATYTPD